MMLQPILVLILFLLLQVIIDSKIIFIVISL